MHAATAAALESTQTTHYSVVDQAGNWAKRLLSRVDQSTEERVTRLYLSAFARPPDRGELASAVMFLAAQDRRRGRASQV